MKIEIFYNAGQTDVMNIESRVGTSNVETLSRQMSQCDLVYMVRLRYNDDTYKDYRNGIEE